MVFWGLFLAANTGMGNQPPREDKKYAEKK